MSDAAALQAKVDLMARSFLDRLPERLAKMDAALEACRTDWANQVHWQELYRLLHSLGGAAGTFGLAALGLEARRIEDILKHKLQAQSWDAGDPERIAAELAGLALFVPAPAAQ